MRALSLSLLILFTSLTPLSAQTLPELPSSTYPEADTFCGFLTLCPKEATPED
jgi:hypothetical protein